MVAIQIIKLTTQYTNMQKMAKHYGMYYYYYSKAPTITFRCLYLIYDRQEGLVVEAGLDDHRYAPIYVSMYNYLSRNVWFITK